MADFRGFLCWTPETAAATINTEAVSPSRAVFLATHAPLRIRRAGLDGRAIVSDGPLIDENTVLKDFLSLQSDTGALLLPIVGDSGTGKSHLVRWVGENLPPSGKYKVIYLEKAKTSLRAVIDALLADADSGALAQLRADIHRFTDGVDAATLSRRLVNALSESLAATTARDVPQHARPLAGPRGLTVVLQDPHVSAFMLGQGKFISRLAEQLLQDRMDGEPDRPMAFTMDDLPTDLLDLHRAAQVTIKLINVISGNTQLQQAAVDLLNQHLEAAVKRVASLGAGRLQDAMLQVRREYARKGKEIILLIEDFALIQGVQKDLLDAVIEAANRYGGTTLAPIRTLMAVTTGYFSDLPETALTRVRATAGYVYNLNVPFTRDDRGESEITSFVGRYLNAARVGRDALENEGGPQVRNPCETCDLVSRCHEQFGVTSEGFGLYPFNSSALVRTIHATAPRNDPYAFVPRTVLGSVIRPVLVDHAGALKEGTFPDTRFRTQFPTADIDEPLSTDVQEVVEAEDHLDADRRKIVLEFWGGAPDHAGALPSAVIEAFALEDRTFSGASATPRQPIRVQPAEREKQQTETETTTEKLPRSLQAKVNAVEDWLTREQVLPQAVASDLRTVIATAVAQRYRWVNPLMREQTQATIRSAWPLNARVVSIEGATENIQGADTAPIKFKRTARNSRYLRSVLLLKNGQHAQRAEHVRRLSTDADRYTASLTTALQKNLQITDDDLVLGLRAALIGAALAGLAWPGMDEAELLAIAFADGRSWARQDAAGRESAWSRALEGHLQYRIPLVERLRDALGVAQGDGKARMIDAARALPLLRRAAAQWDWQVTGSDIPEWVKKAVRNFADWTDMVEAQNASLRRKLDGIRRHHPRGTTGAQVLAAVRDALLAAEDASIPVPLATRADITERLARAQDADWKILNQLEDDLLRAEEPEAPDAARITAAVRDRGVTIQVVSGLLQASDAWLTTALEHAASRTNTHGDEAARGVQELLTEWRSLSAPEEDR
ncbi:protein DpdH [Streptomyces barringtoniae]|uniref:protein DpdH n=1 Tax=Streptomyces barringtoniae TaxID=2892029 RepID=UPI001E387116|nr:protein DpdH [Streptomyces barringtoniae]MCC5479048.1 ATP-binding protein [Streptomyces barringtoniae]